MERLPESEALSSRVLHSSRLRIVGLIAISAFFTAAGVLMVRARAEAGWATLAFGLVCLAVFVFIFFRPNRLELSADGFATVTLGRRWNVEWSQCGEFGVYKDEYTLGSTPMVVFDYDAPGKDHVLLDLTAIALVGSNATLPETYGMSASDLAELLNRYRLAAGAPE
ncbi:MAG: hypothetical protein ACR2KK_19020 [Acidimicrobiales bacterium]